VTILHGTGDHLYGRRAELRNVVTRSGMTSPYPFPAYELELNDGNSFGFAEPVVTQGQLVGLTSNRQNNVIFALPGMVIKHFTNDRIEDGGNYRGFPFVGMATHRLDSPDLRRYLGLKTEGGVRISKVMATSPFRDVLKADDVLTKVDETELDAQGNYKHRLWGKMFFSYLVAQKYAGDTVKMTVIRQGEALVVEKQLSRFDRNGSSLAYFRPDIEVEPHLIFGGLVFQELSLPYLLTWGDEWYTQAPDRLLYFWNQRNDPSDPPGQHFIILNRILSDSYNQGHQSLEDLIVEKVNGKSIHSVHELNEALQQPVVRNKGAYAVIEFYFGAPAVMLSYDGLEDAHKRIAKNYSVKPAESFFRKLPHADRAP
jgi:hypothetical protein